LVLALEIIRTLDLPQESMCFQIGEVVRIFTFAFNIRAGFARRENDAVALVGGYRVFFDDVTLRPLIGGLQRKRESERNNEAADRSCGVHNPKSCPIL
jgi:hypothetical protein